MYDQAPDPSLQYYAPYSYQLQMDRYVRDQARQEFEYQQRQYQWQYRPEPYEPPSSSWGCVPYTITDEEACD
jgi:hypothetical protein